MNKQSSDNLGALVMAAGLAILLALLFRMVLISAVIGGAVWLLVELLS